MDIDVAGAAGWNRDRAAPLRPQGSSLRKISEAMIYGTSYDHLYKNAVHNGLPGWPRENLRSPGPLEATVRTSLCFMFPWRAGPDRS